MNFNKLTQKQLSEALGITPRSIQRWDGCPRNNDGSYSLPAVFKWRTSKRQTSGPSMKEIDEKSKEALARWRDEKAKLAELERRRLEHELVEVEAVQRIMFNTGQQAREMLEAIPARLAPLVAAESDSFGCRRLLEDEIYFSLRNLTEFLKTHPESIDNDNVIEAQLDSILIALKDRKKDPIEFIKTHIADTSLAYIEEQKKNEKRKK